MIIKNTNKQRKQGNIGKYICEERPEKTRKVRVVIQYNELHHVRKDCASRTNKINIFIVLLMKTFKQKS